VNVLSEDKNNKVESELRANKIEIIRLLASSLVNLNQEQFKNFKIEEDKPIAYYDATIDILKRQIKNAELGQSKLLKFDKTEEERANLTPEELELLKEQQAAMNRRVDSFLATLEPRASLRGNLHLPNNVILRYRGKEIGDEFLQKYPFGVLL